MALTDALTAALAPGIPAKVGDRPAGVGNKPFIVFWPDAPARSARTLAQPNAKQTTTIVCHCLGLTKEAAEIAEQKLADAVYGLYGIDVDDRTVE